jgi:hypothetical protein
MFSVFYEYVYPFRLRLSFSSFSTEIMPMFLVSTVHLHHDLVIKLPLQTGRSD